MFPQILLTIFALSVGGINHRHYYRINTYKQAIYRTMEDDFLEGLNPAQREAVLATEGPCLVVAGAGSGKTRVLTYRIAQLMRQGVKPWQIMALTFTNKAAKEMRERIANVVGDSARALWMGTFHSMFAKILRQEAELLGLSSSFSIYDTTDSQTLVRQIVKENSNHNE